MTDGVVAPDNANQGMKIGIQRNDGTILISVKLQNDGVFRRCIPDFTNMHCIDALRAPYQWDEQGIVEAIVVAVEHFIEAGAQ